MKTSLASASARAASGLAASFFALAIASSAVSAQDARSQDQLANIDLTALPHAEAKKVMGWLLSDRAVTVNTNTGWFSAASLTAWRTGDDGHDYAIIDADYFFGDESDRRLTGDVSHASEDWGYGIAGTIGQRLASGKLLTVSVDYAHIDSDDQVTIEDDAAGIFLTQGSEQTDIDPPDLNEPGSFAAADLEIDRWIVDLEAGKTLNLGSDLALTLLGGARIAYLDHDLEIFAFENGAAGDDNSCAGNPRPPSCSTTKKQNNEIYGAGPKLAAQMAWHRGDWALGLAGSGTLLVAGRDYSIREPSEPRSQGSGGYFVDSDETGVIPVLDASAEISKRFMLAGMPSQLTLGYRFESWLDALRQISDQDQLREAWLNRTYDLTMHGPTIRLGVELPGAGQFFGPSKALAEAETAMGALLADKSVTVNTSTGWFSAVSLTAWRAGDDGHDYAVLDGNGYQPSVGSSEDDRLNGDVSLASEDWGYGVAGTIGQRLASGKLLMASVDYAHINSDDQVTIEDDAAQIFLTQGSEQTNVDPRDLAEPGSFATADLEIDRWIVDLEAGKTLNLGSDLALTLLGGARIAYLDHDLKIFAFENGAAGDDNDCARVFPNPAPPSCSTTKKQTNEIYGVGPKLAAQIAWHRGDWALGLAGSGTLLVAGRDYAIREPSEPPSVAGDGYFVDSDETGVIPVLDARAEISKRFMLAGMPSQLTLGYRFESWLDALRQISDQDDTGEAWLNRTYDLTMHGPTIRLGVELSGAGQPFRASKALAGAETAMGALLADKSVTVNTSTGWFSAASLTAWRAGDDGHDYAVLDGDGYKLGTGSSDDVRLNGDVSVASEDWGYGIAGTIGQRLASGKLLMASVDYAHIDSDDQVTIEDDAAQIFLTQTGQAANIKSNNLDEPGSFATADLEIDRWIVDLEAGKTLNLGSDLAITLLGGARIAYLDHDLKIFAFENGAAGDSNFCAGDPRPPSCTTTKKQNNEIFGGGPKLAAQMAWHHGDWALGLAGSGTLLIAGRDYSIREPSEPPGEREDGHFVDDDETGVIPVLDASVEISKSFMLAGMPSQLALGYRFESWLDALRQISDQDSFDEAFGNNHTYDLTMHGPTIRFAIQLSEPGHQPLK